MNFFTNDEIRDAKAVLAEKFKTTIGDNTLWAERRHTIARPPHEAKLDDVIALPNLFDVQEILRNVQFAAVVLERLPKYGSEELNIGSIIDRHQKLDITVGNLSREL